MIVPVLWFNELASLDNETKRDLEQVTSPTRTVCLNELNSFIIINFLKIIFVFSILDQNDFNFTGVHIGNCNAGPRSSFVGNILDNCFISLLSTSKMFTFFEIIIIDVCFYFMNKELF